MVTGAVVTDFPAVWKDSLVRVKADGKIYRIKKINAKSLLIVDAAGKEFVLKGNWERGIEDVDATHPDAVRFTGDELTQTVFYRVGNVVRWPSATNRDVKGRLLVVTKVNADGDCNLSPLGGNVTGQYLRSVPWRVLEKVEGEVTVSNA